MKPYFPLLLSLFVVFVAIPLPGCAAFFAPAELSAAKGPPPRRRRSREQPRVVVAASSSTIAVVVGHHRRRQRHQDDQYRRLRRRQPKQRHPPLLHAGRLDDDNRDDEEGAPTNNGKDNPYADPNYPDLEFIDYDDPEYSVDQGLEGDDDLDYYEPSSEVGEDAEEDRTTLVEIEAMRESRRKRNDEYQFETYHAKVLRGGERSLGEWTIFQTDTFMGKEAAKGRRPDAPGVPRLLKWDKVLKVVSRGTKISVDGSEDDENKDYYGSSSSMGVVLHERIVHEEQLATYDDFPTLMMSEANTMDEGAKTEGVELNWEIKEREHVEHKYYWPKEMAHVDFRGPGGNMCVGKAYTICDALPLFASKNEDRNLQPHDGPFSEMRTELGISDNNMRFRIKLDYALLDEGTAEDSSSSSSPPPPLHLRTLTVCRETLDGYWPRPSDNEAGMDDSDDSNNKEPKKSEIRRKNQEEITRALFGPPGAPGGLYDPPPVGSEERAIENYMLLDFEGGATVLLPHKLDQCHPIFDDGAESATTSREDSSLGGWVTSLDWTPGRIRYQVDRKVLGGVKLKGLRTLELSEVQGEDADKWRPKDGGANMRQ